MPIFEYNCGSCGEHQEVLVKLAQRTNEVGCSCGDVATRAMSLPSRVWAPTRKGQ